LPCADEVTHDQFSEGAVVVVQFEPALVEEYMGPMFWAAMNRSASADEAMPNQVEDGAFAGTQFWAGVTWVLNT
jgi:hypothetical protein